MLVRWMIRYNVPALSAALGAFSVRFLGRIQEIGYGAHGNIAAGGLFNISAATFWLPPLETTPPSLQLSQGPNPSP